MYLPAGAVLSAPAPARALAPPAPSTPPRAAAAPSSDTTSPKPVVRGTSSEAFALAGAVQAPEGRPQANSSAGAAAAAAAVAVAAAVGASSSAAGFVATYSPPRASGGSSTGGDAADSAARGARLRALRMRRGGGAASTPTAPADAAPGDATSGPATAVPGLVYAAAAGASFGGLVPIRKPRDAPRETPRETPRGGDSGGASGGGAPAPLSSPSRAADLPAVPGRGPAAVPSSNPVVLAPRAPSAPRGSISAAPSASAAAAAAAAIVAAASGGAPPERSRGGSVGATSRGSGGGGGGVSNRGRIVNALSAVALAGAHRRGELEAALAAIAAHEPLQLLILLASPDALSYRALYAYDPVTCAATKIHGTGPMDLSRAVRAAQSTPATGAPALADEPTPVMVAATFKYSTGARKFEPLASLAVSLTTDALAIKPVRSAGTGTSV